MNDATTKPQPSTTGTGPMKRHIVKREGPVSMFKGPGAPLQDLALCGVMWDRAHPTGGEFCEACVAEFRRRHPSWPLPGSPL